ncbi:MAG: DUF4129 domain-containing protein [Chloroflexi bacterium]|nr:DUF4129 domain-containing protein [Chloroflexota bacterium]
MNVLSYRRPALEVIFIFAEALAWFMAIVLLATIVERSFLTALADRLALNFGPAGLPQAAATESVVRDLREAAGSEVGPPAIVVMAAAAGGFLLMRYAPRLHLGPGLTSVVMVAATLLGVNVLLHLAIGDFRVWDASRLVLLLNDPASQVATGVDLEAFVRDPDIEGPHAGALAVTFVGLIAVWFRFMLAARSPVRVDRMARSFTISFIAVLVAVLVARIADVDAAGRWAVPQFVAGLLGLAIGNHERAVPVEDAEARATPWLTSVGGTLGLLAAAAGVIGLLAYLQFGTVLSAVGDVLLVVIEFVAILIVTPIYWIVANLLTAAISFLQWIFGSEGQLPDILREPLSPEDVGLSEDQAGDRGFPAWIVDSVKFFALIGTAYLMYWVGKRLLSNRSVEQAPVEEQRARRTGGAGLSTLLADLVSFRRRPPPDRWMNANEVYRLFGRALGVSSDRGLTMLPSETPGEFAETALVHLSSPPVADAARLFERVRFGRHQPSDDEVRNASRALAQWDETNPATEELRERIRGHRQIDEADALKMRLALAKRGLRPTDEGILRGE